MLLGVEEEGRLSLDEDLPTPLVLLGGLVEGVQDHTLLPGGKGDSLLEPNDLLVDVLDVQLNKTILDEPFGPGLSPLIIEIDELFCRPEVKTILIIKHLALDDLDNFLEGVWEVGACIPNEPFFPSKSFHALPVLEEPIGSEPERIIWLDHNGFDELDDFHLNPGIVGKGALLLPFLSSNSIDFVVIEVPCCD